jgi:hypothetical protein
MANKALCHSNSSVITKRGFLVNTKSPTGLSIWNKGESTLSNSTDSHQMVPSLCMLQEFVKYDMFLTFLCAQKDHPRTCKILFQWKFSNAWGHSICDYPSMSKIKQNEFAISMEELYSLMAFRNWMESRQLMLDFISNDISSHGACTCLFSRTGY